MALSVCFSQLTNIFFLQSPDSELSFWEEIWGCVKYIGIPYDTVMSMPVQNRKILIRRHNHEGDIITNAGSRDNNSITGEALNSYAAMEQKKLQKY